MKGRKNVSVRLRLLRIIIVRIIVLAAVVVGYALPLPWRIIVPLSIGSVTIIIETLICFKSPKQQDEIKYRAAEPKKESKRDERKAGKTTGKETSRKGNKKAA